MDKVNQLKVGSVLSETSFFVVKGFDGDKVIFEGGLAASKEYVKAKIVSADYYKTEEQKTMTQLSELVLANPRMAISVAFYKSSKPKTKKQYKLDLENQSKAVGEDFMKRGSIAIEEALKSPVLPYIKGELRVMKGYHFGELNELGRINFIDMETPTFIQKQIDPRTIQWAIINEVKYVLK